MANMVASCWFKHHPVMDPRKKAEMSEAQPIGLLVTDHKRCSGGDVSTGRHISFSAPSCRDEMDVVCAKNGSFPGSREAEKHTNPLQNDL